MAAAVIPSVPTGVDLTSRAVVFAKRFAQALAASRNGAALAELRRHTALIRDLAARGVSRPVA